ncbi:hypothetical protein ABPG72_003154 [Tetrahymena utriculariae]
MFQTKNNIGNSQNEIQNQCDNQSQAEFTEMKQRLEEREKNNEHLSQFEIYLKDKIDSQLEKQKKENKFHDIDPGEINRRKLALSHIIDRNQDIYEYVQKEIQLQKEGVKSPNSLSQQFNNIYYDSITKKKIKKATYEDFYSQPRTRPSTSHNKMYPEQVFGENLTKKEEKQLDQYRKQFNMHHFYKDWLNEKKIRLNSQIDAYINSISKLNAIEEQQENLIQKDKFYLSSDQKRHIERIMSANQSSRDKSHIKYITLHSQPVSINSNQLQSPTLMPYKQYRMQQIVNNSKNNTQQKNLNNTNTNMKQNKLIDTLKTNKNRPSTSNKSPKSQIQAVQKQNQLSRQGSLKKSKSPEKKNITNIFEQKNEVALFNNFVYSSPFPKWIVQNRKYEELKQSEQYDMNKKIISICKMETFNRTAFQKHIVALFLQKISLFKMMPFHMLEVIAQRLTYQFVDQTQYICKQGDKGDCMYIIFQGQVEIIINGFVIKKIFSDGEFVGRTALETDKPRNADMRAKKPCHLLLLSRMDYQQCLSRAIASEKGNISNFILNHPFFRHFRADKVEKLCDEIKARFLAPKECLFKETDPIDNFYIVKQGLLIKTMQVELEQQNKWPNKDENGQVYWENFIQGKKVIYTIEFTGGDIVGYYDMMIPNEQGVRTETIDSIQDTFVLYISKNIFNLIFDEDDMLIFREHHRKKYPTNYESLKQKIKDEEGQYKANIMALEDAVRLKLQSCEQIVLEKNNEKINQFIKQQRQKKKAELRKKIPFEYKQPVIRKLKNQNEQQNNQ